MFHTGGATHRPQRRLCLDPWFGAAGAPLVILAVPDEVGPGWVAAEVKGHCADIVWRVVGNEPEAAWGRGWIGHVRAVVVPAVVVVDRVPV